MLVHAEVGQAVDDASRGCAASRSICMWSMWASANALTFAAISSAAACLSAGSVGYGKSRSPLNWPKNSALANPTSDPAMQFFDLLLLLGDLLGGESHVREPLNATVERESGST